MDQLGAAQKAAIETSAKVSEGGTPVRYIRSNFYPGDQPICYRIARSERPAPFGEGNSR
jgi:hypothetical protein